ncbi:glycosyl transferase family 2 [Vulcanisaeta moutnovskia 768-28]|uniref:Glycosyl transferase family 2 n=2 Tax=Vulcanisaeta TaxID=164450 RepID=F0QY53_VULM7|nr:glycosyl transferase family 2 [Vulcanisaeta moutnovskia 768-28]
MILSKLGSSKEFVLQVLISRDVNRIDVAFVGTVYNNAPFIETSLRSIFRVIKNLPEINFEFVIVDSFSADGTYENLLRLFNEFRKLGNLKRAVIIRFSCTRGVGRRLAVSISRARYIIPIDLDTLYDDYLLSRVISEAIMMNLDKCIVFANPGLHIMCPKDIIMSVGNYRDLNYGEDIELLARIFSIYSNKALSLPIRLAYDLRVVDSGVMKDRERRYSGSLFKHVVRKMRNMVDRYLAYGYDLEKLVREHYLLYKNNIFALVVNVLMHLFVIIPLSKTRGIRSKLRIPLSNYLYVDLMTYLLMIDPALFGISIDKVIDYFKDFSSTKEFKYISRFYSNINSISYNNKYVWKV